MKKKLSITGNDPPMQNGIYSYKLYGNSSDYEQLSKEEQTDLVRLYRKNKSPKILDRIIMSNFKFIIKMAMQYRHKGLSMDDLISLSYIGFRHAIDKFKYKFGMSLVNYAANHIKNAIRLKLVQEHSLIKMPFHLWKTMTTLDRLMKDKVNDNDIMFQMKISYDKLSMLKLYRLSFDTTSHRLGNKMFDDSDTEYDVGCEDSEHEMMEKMDDSEAIVKMVYSTLNGRQLDIVVKRFGLDGNIPMRLLDIAKLYGRTTERIRQIEMGAIGKLRKQMTENDR